MQEFKSKHIRPTSNLLLLRFDCSLPILLSLRFALDPLLLESDLLVPRSLLLCFVADIIQSRLQSRPRNCIDIALVQVLTATNVDFAVVDHSIITVRLGSFPGLSFPELSLMRALLSSFLEHFLVHRAHSCRHVAMCCSHQIVTIILALLAVDFSQLAREY